MRPYISKVGRGSFAILERRKKKEKEKEKEEGGRRKRRRRRAQQYMKTNLKENVKGSDVFI